jgi:hypothetical protein
MHYTTLSTLLNRQGQRPFHRQVDGTARPVTENSGN